MNFVKNLMKDSLKEVDKNAFRLSSNRVALTKGLCITCDRKAHCIWAQNQKIYCQHFE